MAGIRKYLSTALAACMILPAVSAFDSSLFDEKDLEKIKQRIEYDITSKQKAYDATLESEGKTWAEGDLKFFGLILEGLKAEQSGNIVQAIEQYKNALNTRRYEMPSYEAFFFLGRAYLYEPDCPKAKGALNEYIKVAYQEIEGTDFEWHLSEEGERKVREHIEFAKWLLRFCR